MNLTFYQTLHLYERLNVHIRGFNRPLYSTCVLLYCITRKDIMYQITQQKEEHHKTLTYCTARIRQHHKTKAASTVLRLHHQKIMRHIK